MKGIERRAEILKLINSGSIPFSGTYLAERFSVSRQVIVQDIALIRAQGNDIISTNRGYLLKSPVEFKRVLKFHHSDNEIEDELCTIVDLGGTVKDVSVNHRVYGHLQADLNISSRLDVQNFLAELKSGKSTPLKDITSDYHYHTIIADLDETLDLIQNELSKKGFLVVTKN